MRRVDQCETNAFNLRSPECTLMPLSRATALIAVILIVVLSAGYAESERHAPDHSPAPAAAKSLGSR
jgi:hypothetical protein